MKAELLQSPIFFEVTLPSRVMALYQQTFVPVGEPPELTPVTQLTYLELMETHAKLTQDAQQMHMDMLMFFASGLSFANKHPKTAQLAEINAIADEAIITAHQTPENWLASTPLMLQLESLLLG